MKLKRIISLVLCFAMVLSTMSFSIFAKDAYIAKVGDAECADAAEMLNALRAASGEVTVEIYGKLETGGFTLNNSNIEKLNFVGMTDTAEICGDRVSYIDVRSTTYPIEYTELILSHINAGQNGDGWLPQYFSTYNSGDVTYKRCEFPNGVTGVGNIPDTTYTFNECIFNNMTKGLYSLFVYGNSTNVIVEGGEFCGIRGIKMYSEGNNDFSNLSVSRATFSDTITEKPAIVLSKCESVTLTDNTFNNTTGEVQVDDDYTYLIDGKPVTIDGTQYIIDSDNFTLVEKNPVPAEPVLSGAGTKAEPYLIENLNDLKAFRDDVNAGNTYEGKYVALTDDINLTGEAWTPIGTSIYDKAPADAKMFAGNFDGGNHTITGLTSGDYVPDAEDIGGGEYSFGLFGYVYGANISNVKLAEVNIDGTTRKDSEGRDVAGSGVAALIGYYVIADDKACVIDNCHVLGGTVNATNNMGGLIGYMDEQNNILTADITIKNCTNAAEVTTDKREAGGILGLLNHNNAYGPASMYGSLTFLNCSNTGNITALDGAEGACAGGILGRDATSHNYKNMKVVFDTCSNSGNITVNTNGESHAAGLGTVFYSDSSWLEIKNSTNTGNVTATKPGNKVYVGGLMAHAGVATIENSTSTGTVTIGDETCNTYVGGIAQCIFLNDMDVFADTINGVIYFLNGGTAPEVDALYNDSGNAHLVETAYKDRFEFVGWYDNADCTGEAYTALSPDVKTYYAKWKGPVAKIGSDYFDTLEGAVEKAKSGDTILLISDVIIEENKNITIPDGVIFNSNGYTVYAADANKTDTSYGYIIAGGKLEIQGNTKVEKFNAGSGNSITINEGASLQVTGGVRVTLGYGSNFNVTGNISDAKTADKENITPSLNIAAGISITGSDDTAFVAKDAYIVLGNTSSSNKYANAKFDFNFENCIVDFTHQFTLSDPKNGMDPSFEISFKDSVVTTPNKLCIGVAKTTMTLDNSSYATLSQFRNSGLLTLKNGSYLKGTMSQPGENNGNTGTIIVDKSELDVLMSNEAVAMGKSGAGTLTLKNDAIASVPYIINSEINIDGTSKLTTSKLLSETTVTIDTDNLVFGEKVTVLEQTASEPTPLADIVTLKEVNGILLNPSFDGGDITLNAKNIAAKLGDNQYFASVSDAFDAAYEAGMKDFVITLVGDTNVNTTDSIDLYSNYDNGMAFNTVTIRQEDASKPYYLNALYTGWTTGKFVFDGVNIIIADQFFGIGKVELINNSTLTRDDDTKNFIFYGDMYIEPGSKYISQIDGISSGSSLTVDGGRTDGAYNTTADYKTVYLTVEAGNTMTMKNGAYVIASNYESSTATIDGTLNIVGSMFEGCETLFVNGVLNIDADSIINVKNIVGTGKIVIDANGMKEEDVNVLSNLNMTGFSGAVDVENANYPIELWRLNTLTRSEVWELVDRFKTLAEAVAAAESGDKIQLIWEEGDAPIVMSSAVYDNKTITITGTALVDWSKGNLFIGRGGEGNGTVIFDNANLKSASDSKGYGIHVSGREKDTNDKYDGTLIINNSSIELDYLINKGNITLDNSTFVVKNGFSIGGRPAKETENNVDATATITLNNGSKVIVNNHNGMGIGYEAIGIMNVNSGSTFECTQNFLITEKGTMNIDGGSAKINGTLTVNGTLMSNGDINGTIVKGENAVIILTGGAYIQDISDYAADGYKALYQESTGLYYVFPDFTVEAIADTENAVAGDIITVEVKVTEGGNYTNASWVLRYDPRYVKYDGTDDKNYKISGSVTDGNTDNGNDEFDENYILGTYKFEVNNDVTPGTAVFEIVSAEVHNYEMAIEFDGVAASTKNDNVQINLKDGTGSIDALELPYNGAELRGNEVTGAPAGARITYSKTNDFTNGTQLPPAFVNVGEHTYYAKIEVDGYAAEIVNGTLTITAIDVNPSVEWSVAPESNHVGYRPVIIGVLDETYKNGTVTVIYGKDEDGNDNVIETLNASDFIYNGHGKAVYAGNELEISGVISGELTLTIKYTAGTNDNYNTSEGSATVDVDKSTINETTEIALESAITGTGNITYDGEIHYVAIDASKLPEGWNATVADHDGVTNFGDVNVVDVIFTDATGKYNDYTATVMVKIIRREVTIYVNNVTKKNGQADSEVLPGSFTASPSIIGNDLGEIQIVRAEGQTGEVEGSYTITAIYTPNNNYIVYVEDGTLTIFDAVVKIEVVDNSKNGNKGIDAEADYTVGTRMILVHTDADYAFFSYNGHRMYDVSDAGYTYFEHDYENDIHQEGTKYQHVYAIVVEAEYGYEATEENEDLYARGVKYEGKDETASYAPVKVTYNADINDKDALHVNDYSTVKGVYNSIYDYDKYQISILKADYNKNKLVNTADAQDVKNVVIK